MSVFEVVDFFSISEPILKPITQICELFFLFFDINY